MQQQGNAPAGGIMPSWSSERVQTLSNMSPLIRAHADELRQHPERYWMLVVGDEFDETTALRVLSLIGPGSAHRKERVASLCRECNVLWAFQVIPKYLPASQTWLAIDDDGDVAGSKFPGHLRNTTRNTTYAPSLASSSQSSPIWCWSHSEDPSLRRRSRLMSHQLANIALILEWDEVFRREMKTVVWDWTGASPAGVLATPVERLQASGDQGLDARRDLEKRKILAHIVAYLDQHNHKSNRASVKQINKDLKAASMAKLEPSSFRHPSIYTMLRDIEGAIFKPIKRPAAGPAPPKAVNNNRPAAPGLLSKIKGMEHRVESAVSGGKAHREFVIGLLENVHEFICQQQDVLCQELWRWRNNEVNKWQMATSAGF
ncbi:hypothetical protein B0H63DRAFT_464569 [Podospora didyma]|uniref:Uncharacterized protein n=1 Tax=Podospora didyma TaxID=330526 RepID=A0AAE0NYC4_9PEZI|nr:hypothetical protein B0H63DRAFT_464569 [Podospora didyma]